MSIFKFSIFVYIIKRKFYKVYLIFRWKDFVNPTKNWKYSQKYWKKKCSKPTKNHYNTWVSFHSIVPISYWQKLWSTKVTFSTRVFMASMRLVDMRSQQSQHLKCPKTYCYLMVSALFILFCVLGEKTNLYETQSKKESEWEREELTQKKRGGFASGRN